MFLNASWEDQNAWNIIGTLEIPRIQGILEIASGNTWEY